MSGCWKTSDRKSCSELGKAQAMMGDKTAARKSYQDFVALWKDCRS